MIPPAPQTEPRSGDETPGRRSRWPLVLALLMGAALVVLAAWGAASLLTRKVHISELWVCARCTRCEERTFREYQSRDGTERLIRLAGSKALEAPDALSRALDPEERCTHEFIPAPASAKTIDLTQIGACSFLLGIRLPDSAAADEGGPRTSCMPGYAATLGVLRQDVLDRQRGGGQYDVLEAGRCAGGRLAYTHRVEDDSETWLYYDPSSGAFLAARDVVNRLDDASRPRGERAWPVALSFSDYVVEEDLLAPVRE